MAKRGVLYTLGQIVDDLSIRLDDESDTRWTEAQKQLAVKVAVRRARGRWWEERLDDTNTYDDTTFRYSLPPACESVEALYFEPISSDLPRVFVSPSRWHIEGTTLVFDKPFHTYDGKTLYIHYLVYLANLLDVTANDGSISGNTLTSSGSTFVTDGVQEGDEVEISGDSGGPYYVSSVDSETQLTLHKSPTAGDSKTFYVARYTDMPYEYLIYAAMAELYEMAARNRPGIEVEENIRWATYYRQLADQALRSQARHPKPLRRF